MMVREFQKDAMLSSSDSMQLPGSVASNRRAPFMSFPTSAGLLGKTVNGKQLASPCDVADYLARRSQSRGVFRAKISVRKQHIRFSYATSLEDIEKGCTRIRDAVGKLD